MELIMQMAVEACFVLLIVALAFAAVFGVTISVRPAVLRRARLVTDRRFDLPGSTDWLDRPHNVDRWFYRYHHVYGTVVIALAAVLLYLLAFGYERPVVELLLPREYRGFVDILADSFRLIMWVLALFSLIIGTIMLVRPSALKGFEHALNRWLSTKDAARRLDREFHGADTLVQKYPRVSGMVIAALAVICLGGLFLYWGTWASLLR